MDVPRLLEEARAARQAGRPAEAEARYRAILAADPGHLPSLNALAFLAGQRGQLDQAIALFERALSVAPQDGEALSGLGHALLAAGRGAEALPVYARALAVRPDAVDLLYNRAVILSDQGQAGEALALLERAQALQPDNAAILYSLGVVLTQLRQPAAALAAFDRALAVDPNLHLARANRAMAALNICDWTRTARIAPELERMVAMGLPVPPLTLLGYSSDKALLRRAAENTVRALVPQMPPPLWRGEAYRHDRLRLAYVSGDLRDHAVGHVLLPLIAGHDRGRFEAIAISTGADDGSAMRARLKGAFDRFDDMAGRSGAEIARHIRALEADIAVDLGGHTGGTRLEVLAFRPAPVQVSFLGFPGTTGAPFIDTLIADAVTVPAGDEIFYSEKIVRLPGCFFPPPRRAGGAAPARRDEGLPARGFVFCAFNNAWKITREMFALWMRLLAAVEDSVLWLKQSDGTASANLKRAAADHGIDPARLVFARDAPLEVHLARHRLADLFLDTLPYGGHATAADALAAGLPVLTCKGESFAGRVAASMLHDLDLPDLVTATPAAYEARALELARDPARLAALREKLARAAGTDRYRADIEAVFLSLAARDPA